MIPNRRMAVALGWAVAATAISDHGEVVVPRAEPSKPSETAKPRKLLPSSNKRLRDRSKYPAHQGAKECARRKLAL